jgi:hypothetical protein
MRHLAGLVACTAFIGALPIPLQAGDAIPPPQLDHADAQPPAIPVDAEFHGRFVTFLDEGFLRRPDAAEVAGRRAESLQESHPDDPRIAYALALIQLRNFHQAEALEHLDASLAVDPAYLPAWQLRLALQLKGKHYSEVIDQLYTLADVVGCASSPPPDLAVRQQTARHIGRVVAFLQGPLNDYELAELMHAHAHNLDVLLGEDLHAAYTTGRVELTREHHALLDEADILEAAAETDKQHDLEQAQAEGEKLDAQRQDVERTQDEWDAIIKEEVGEIDSRLEALEKRHESVQQELTSLTEAISVVRIEIQRLLSIRDRMIRDGEDRDPPRPVNTASIDLQIAALQVELDQYLVQYEAASQEHAQILRAADSLVRQRRTALANYQKATGRAAERIQQLNRWTDRLESETTETQQTPASDARAVNALHRRIRTWSTYDNFDLDVEKDRLLAEYTVVP